MKKGLRLVVDCPLLAVLHWSQCFPDEEGIETGFEVPEPRWEITVAVLP